MGQEICMECKGRKTIVCPDCRGTGQSKNQMRIAVYQGIINPCPTCEVEKRVICPNCEGKGFLVFY